LRIFLHSRRIMRRCALRQARLIESSMSRCNKSHKSFQHRDMFPRFGIDSAPKRIAASLLPLVSIYARNVASINRNSANPFARYKGQTSRNDKKDRRQGNVSRDLISTGRIARVASALAPRNSCAASILIEICIEISRRTSVCAPRPALWRAKGVR